MVQEIFYRTMMLFSLLDGPQNTPSDGGFIRSVLPWTINQYTLAQSGIPKKRRRPSRPEHSDRDLPDLLQRNFSATEPNRVCVTDTTEQTIGEGELYRCVIKDL